MFRRAARRGQILTVIAMDDLEVLHGGLGDTPVEVEYVGLGVVVPHRGLVLQLNDALRVLVLPACQQRLMLLGWGPHLSQACLEQEPSQGFPGWYPGPST